MRAHKSDPSDSYYALYLNGCFYRLEDLPKRGQAPLLDRLKARFAAKPKTGLVEELQRHQAELGIYR